jgi:sugar/nucleoside kinase (ribokinase family)
LISRGWLNESEENWSISGFMERRMRKKVNKERVPSVVGAGLIALDIILDENGQTAFAAGGTCANVLIALSYLGWKAKAVSRLGADYASEIVLEDLKIFGVDTTFAQLEPQTGTPVIVQRMRKDSDGRPYHTFSFTCPSCGRRLPSYQSVPAKAIEEKVEEITGGVKVAFLDRLSRGTINLASGVRDNGGIVVFEPSSVHDGKLFKEMLEICHIVKYSHERLLDYGDVQWGADVVVEIQTLGRGGVRFRQRDSRRRRTVWHHSDAPQLQNLADSCGAGDWFSAGIIHGLCRHGKKTLIGSGITEINRAVAFAQRLSVWNCGYVGARGGMYSASGRSVLKSIARLQDSLVAPHPKPERDGITARICGCTSQHINLEPHPSSSFQRTRCAGAQLGKTVDLTGSQR